MAALTFLCWLITVAYAQVPQNPVRDSCRIYGHQAAVIDRKIYIDGGWQYASPISSNPVPTISMASPRESDLLTDAATDQGLFYGDLDTLNQFNFPQVYANLSKNTSVPDVSGGILWADQVNKVFWLYGGEYSSAPSPFQLWGYDVVLNQWNLSSAAATASSPIQRVAYGAGATVDELGRGYYYGGYLNKLTNPLWSGPPLATNSLIVYDMNENTLANKTGPRDGIGRAEGVMVSVPVSASGVLLYFGGVSYPYHNSTEVAQPMDTILLYDIADANWVTQKATGQIPPNRRQFCGGVTWARDKSSYNVYIYGGFGFGENSTGFDDVYILTMPAFRWIKWYPEQDGASNPHGLLSCNVVSGSQMIITGGNFTQHSDCDSADTFHMHNLNLGQNSPANAKWFRFLPNITSYVVPPAVIDVVGGSPSGGATKLAPDTWSDRAIEVYFRDKAQFRPRTATRSLPSATVTPASGSPASKNLGAIVGGAVGGLAFIVIVGVLAFCWHRRRNKTPRSGNHPGSPVSTRLELSGVSPYDEKNGAVTQVARSPNSPQSPVALPYHSAATTVPPTLAPIYTHPQAYSPHEPAYQQYHPQMSPQYQYPPHQTVGHPHYYHENMSAPEGWTTHPGQMQLHQQYLLQQQHHHQPQQQQQYFPPPPDVQRVSPPLHEMSATKTPGPYQTHSPVGSYTDSERIMYHSALTNNPYTGGLTPVRRREVGSGGSSTSPTETTATYASDAGSRF